MSFGVETHLRPDSFLDFCDDDLLDHRLQAFVYRIDKLLFLRLNHLLDGLNLLFPFLRLRSQTISRLVDLGGKED